MFRITLAQLNFTVGDIEGNVERMIAAARKAALDDSEMIVFSELALCAYYPGDMLDDKHFLDRIEEGLATLKRASTTLPDLHWVIGTPTLRDGPGKHLHNSLLVLRNGTVRL